MIQEEMQSKLSFYLEAFEEAKRRVNDDHAASVIVQELAKDARRLSSQKPRDLANGDQPATDKQLAYLEKLGVKIRAGLTKGEASMLIDSALGQDA